MGGSERERDKEREKERERERKWGGVRERERGRGKERETDDINRFFHRSQAFQKSTSTGSELKNETLSRIYGNFLFIDLTVIKTPVL